MVLPHPLNHHPQVMCHVCQRKGMSGPYKDTLGAWYYAANTKHRGFQKKKIPRTSSSVLINVINMSVRTFNYQRCFLVSPVLSCKKNCTRNGIRVTKILLNSLLYYPYVLAYPILGSRSISTFFYKENIICIFESLDDDTAFHVNSLNYMPSFSSKSEFPFPNSIKC